MRILIVTHGPLASAMKESARMFFGDTVNDVGTLELYPSDSPERLAESVEQFVRSKQEDVLIFVDIQSGSPYNMSALAIDSLKDEYKVECFTGVNMPLLMEVLGMKDGMSLEAMVDHVESIASTTVVNLRKSLDI